MVGYIGLGRIALGGGDAFGDPTAITPNNVDAFLTSLGLTQAGTGTTWGETGQAATPLYAVAANKVPLAVETIGGKQYFGPIVNPAGTNLALHDRDGTNAAWVKTNCTAELRTGSLSDAGAANGHTLITATGNNATFLQAITSTSGERVTKWWAQTDDEDVFVSHGAPTGAALSEDDFSSDTSGDWSYGADHVDGVKSVTGGALTYTIGAGDGTVPRIYIAVTGCTINKRYRIQGTLGGTAAGFRGLRFSSSNAGASYNAQLVSSGVVYERATATTMYLVLLASGGAGETITIDDLSVYEVAETELTPGSNPVPTDLAAATFANPQPGIRIANSGDSVRLYGVQHQVAARPLRPYIGPTAGSTVTSGGRSLRRTLGADITEVNISVIVPKNIGVIFRCHEVAGYQGSIYLYQSSDKYNLSNVRGSSLGGFVQGTGTIDVGAGDHDKIDVEYNDTLCRFRVNNGSWTSITRYGIPGSRVVGIGTDWQGNGAASEPVLAFRDNIGNLLDGNRGWNHRLLNNWS